MASIRIYKKSIYIAGYLESGKFKATIIRYRSVRHKFDYAVINAGKELMFLEKTLASNDVYKRTSVVPTLLINKFTSEIAPYVEEELSIVYEGVENTLDISFPDKMDAHTEIRNDEVAKEPVKRVEI